MMNKLVRICFCVIFFTPTLVFADVISVNSGDWNNPATWGGRVPNDDEAVTISAGHNISINNEVVCGSLNTSLATNSWAIISGSGQLTISNGGNIRRVSFQNSGGVSAPLLSGNIIFDHCTFANSNMLRIGSSQTSTGSSIVVSNSDFRNVFGGAGDKYIIKIVGGQGQYSGDLLIEHNTIIGKDASEGVRIENRDGAKIKNNVFIDSQILQLTKDGGMSSSGGHLLEGNLFAHINEPDGYTSNRVVYVIQNEQPINIIENYIFDNSINDHTITGGTDRGQTIIKKNIFEYSSKAKEANTIMLPATSLLVEENISIGYASLINSVGSNSGSAETIVRNNITYNNGPVVPSLFLSENGLPSFPMRFENNISVNGRYAFRHNGNPSGNAVVGFSDNNIFWNMQTPYHSNITVSSGKNSDTTNVNPNLTEPSRGFLSYYTHIEGISANLQVVANKFATMNGYNSTTKQQGSANNNYQPQVFRQWVAQGFNRGDNNIPTPTPQPTITSSPTPQPTTTPGRKYNINNFIQLIQNWLQTGNEQSDVNNDNIVNTRDLGIMMSNWE